MADETLTQRAQPSESEVGLSFYRLRGWLERNPSGGEEPIHPDDLRNVLTYAGRSPGAGETADLARRIDLALSDSPPLTGEACKHGWDRAVCSMTECGNPYAFEPLLKEAAAALRAGNPASTTSTAEQVGTAKKPFDFECQHGWMACGMCDADPASPFQGRVKPWMLACFGAEIAADTLERNDRFIEEALELVQSLDYSGDRAHALVDYVFGRPAGEPGQEVGGVMVTLAALCLAAGLDMHEAGEAELARITRPEIIEKIRAKQAAKPTGSALPVAPSPGEGEAPVAEQAAKLAAIISDDEVARVHGHANFGSLSPREVVNDGVRKYAVGYSSGHTQLCILLEHGLITKPRPGRYDASLTKKGKRYARVLFADAFTRPAPATPEGLREKFARIVDPHAFLSIEDGGDAMVSEMVRQSREDAYRKADRLLAVARGEPDAILSALQPQAQGGEAHG